MRILIVDNGTSHMRELRGLFSSHMTDVVGRSAFTVPMERGYDCVVLSGSSDTAIAGNEEKFAE